MTGQSFLLDGGTAGWFVYVDTFKGGTPTQVEFSPDREADDWTDAEPATRRGWWNAAPRPTRLRLTGEPRRRVESYVLMDGVEPSDLFPATLSGADYRERVYDDDGEVLDERTGALYEAVLVDVPAPVEILSVEDLLVLEGAPEPSDGLTWQARLPFELQHRREYLHLFPGEFGEDFRQAVHDAIEKLPGVTYCFLPRTHNRGQLIEVTVRVPFDPPLTTTRTERDRRRKPQLVERTVYRKVAITVPARIGGPDRATAKAEWDRLLGGALSEVRGASVKACGCCEGRGFVEANHA
jgi:hypothetical protein